MQEPLIFELSSECKAGNILPMLDVPEKPKKELLPENFLRKEDPELPQITENEVIRHFIALSVKNYHVDKGLYPLGSCTMKYNPKVNENIARFPGFSEIHPFQDESTVQGALQLIDELGKALCEISGLGGISLQPAAGAHGELTGLMVIRAYHEQRGNARKHILYTDSAHGTNPASVTISGYESKQISSNEKGQVDLEELKAAVNEDTAALMLTNPNTLGLFESEVEQITKILHDAGALVYMDGANLNALMGIVRPGDMGFDVMHFNLHKTFSTPHGGGGPGAGPIGVADFLVDFLPHPVVMKTKDGYTLKDEMPRSIGKVEAFYGNFGVMVKALTYIRMLGASGLRRVSEGAVINANYLLSKLQEYYELPYKGPAMHEFVLSGDRQREKGVKTLDIAKRLLDLGFHAPTVYFPLIVREAIMIEPTETESKRTLDAFADAMIRIAKEAEENPEVLKNAPSTTLVSRLDEVKAVKDGNIKYID